MMGLPTRRLLPVGLALAALVATAALVGVGLRCGIRSVSESCFTAEECEAASECKPYVHPFAYLYAGLSVVALVGAFRRTPTAGLAAGVVGMPFGALAGFSLGLWGLGMGVLLAASGWAVGPRADHARRDRLLAWSAAPALLLPLPLLFVLAVVAPPSLALLWVVVLAPSAAWLALAVGTARGEQISAPKA